MGKNENISGRRKKPKVSLSPCCLGGKEIKQDGLQAGKSRIIQIGKGGLQRKQGKLGKGDRSRVVGEGLHQGH